jgi:hypothetical protein
MKSFKAILFLAVAILSAAVFANLAFAADEEIDISAYSIVDGEVRKDGTAFAEGAMVREIPAGVGGPLRFWSAFSPGISEAVAENETGVWFFSKSGEALAFQPLESEYDALDMAMNPDGDKFILTAGSYGRPDVTFGLYEFPGTDKKAEFSGVVGSAEWIDPVRFVFTRIDDARETEDGVFSMNALRLSVAMYDTSEEETTVLKEATDTKNYWFQRMTEDGASLVVNEDSVKSEKDWGDEEKIETREIKVEIPAAG